MNNKMAEMKKVEVTDVSLPKGGGAIKAIGESFKPNVFSGTGNFSIPIYTTPCREFEPKITIDYNSGSGSGILGIGFSLSIPSITRNTDKGIPKYDNSDRFFLSNTEELVPKLKDNLKEVDKRKIEKNGAPWKVTQYIPRVEKEFQKIEFWEGSEESFWKVTSRENIISFYGQSENARICNPKNKKQVFQWLLEKIIDERGNKVEYFYKKENNENVVDEIYEKNREYGTNKYLKSIRYGNYFDNEFNEQWAFEVIFDYGEYDIQDEYLRNIGNNPYDAVKKWGARTIPFSSYRSGFEIRTLRLCRSILMFHHFEKELGETPCLVRATKLKYDESSNISPMLTEIEVMGLLRRNDGSYDIEYAPPLEFTYSKFNPLKGSFKELRDEEGKAIPGYINKAQYDFIDLYGEGIEGLLYSDENATFYMKPKGEGKYEIPIPPIEFPIERDLNSGSYTLTSLEGNGKLDLMVNTPERGGFYQVNHDGSWEKYCDFKSSPLDLSNPSAQLVDLDGDGCSEVLVLDHDGIKFYPSLKKDGFGLPERESVMAELDEDFPIYNNEDNDEFLGFADMFGDGLFHRVRIRNGMVECWPNLGYGRFGKKIIFGNAPRFENRLDASRLFLGDLDGSGATDIAYAYPDRVEVFVNKGGNSFGQPLIIPLPGIYDELSRITFADINGSGSTALVFSKMGVEQKHYYYDATEGKKPYLLTKIDNNMGVETNIDYVSSVKFYLEDQQLSKPWKTSLPFPVQVVEKVESIDSISNSKMVTRYKYHEGYYDHADREFRGFGYVEEWDREKLQIYSYNDLSKEIHSKALDNEYYVSPSYIKRWYHTGAYIEEEILSRQYRDEYYNKDVDAYCMPDSVLDYLMRKNDGDAMYEAHRALAGKLLREEIYENNDNLDLVAHPYSVMETSFYIRQIQPKESNKSLVFYVYEREKINYHYEKNPNDPRIQHTFTLSVDGFGNEEKVCEIFYPRRKSEYSEQEKLKAVAEVSNFINSSGDAYIIGVPYEVKTYEIGGLDKGDRVYFSYDELEKQLNIALHNVILNEEAFLEGEIQGRMLSWERAYFWNEDQEDYLVLGETSPLILLHHIESAEFSKQGVINGFQNKVTDSMLENQGGYVLKEGYWWNRGNVQYYYKKEEKKFCLPWKIENIFAPEQASLHMKTTLEYDFYCIEQVREEMYLTGDIKNSTEILMDYITLQPKESIDINGNVSQVIFDPLGRIKVVSYYGTTDGKLQGDGDLKEYSLIDNGSFEDVINNPNKYIQNASVFFYYDSLAWKERRGPVKLITLIRENYVSAFNNDNESRIQIQIDYSDGFGRVIENKVKVEPGNAILWDDQGNVSEGYAFNRWRVLGRTVYNSKEKPVKQYKSYFSSIASYEDEKSIDRVIAPPTIIHYDSLFREIRKDNGKGFFSKVEFTPWEERYFDENDTIKDSNYFKAFMRNYPENPTQQEKDQKDALDKAAVFYDTPEIKILDSLGNVFIDIQQALKDGKYITWFSIDIDGKVLIAIDPRLYSFNEENNTKDYNFKYMYSMSGKILVEESVDSGIKWSLPDMFGNPIHVWNSRGFHSIIAYDGLQRIVEVRVEGEDGKGTVLNQTVEKVIYGEYSGIKTGNLRGQVYKKYDQAGIQNFSLYDIKGKAIQVSKQLKKDWKNEVNWDDINLVEISDEIFNTSYTYDALGKIINEKNPDESIYIPKYNRLGLLRKMEVKYKEGTTETFIENIEYNAEGQQLEISYGNGVTTKYTYEDTTLNLLNILSTRQKGSPMQNISYTYDPVGNVIRVRDNSYGTVFYNQQKVEPLSDYTYDGLYRLIASTGRQHPGIKANTHRYEFKQCGFTPFSLPNINDGQKLENYYESYSYDASGNVTTIKHAAPSASWTRNINISPSSNRTVKISSINGTLDFYDTRYDDSGNMQNLEHISNILWNYRDNIARADIILRDGDDTDSEYYVYDSDGRRVRKVSERKISSTITEIEEKIYLGTFEVKRIKRKNGTAETVILDRQSLHIMDEDKRIAVINLWIKDDNNREVEEVGSRKYRYQLDNLLGCACLEVDDHANIISYEEYYPFGGTSIIAGKSQREVSVKEYRYSGKERDDVTGLYYYGARYYAPWLGRWLNPDPEGIIDGLNLYAFVSNNPIVFVDYDGCVKKLKKGKPKKKLKKAVGVKKGGKAKPIAGIPKKIVKVRLSKKKYPEASRHIQDAIAAGHPSILTIDRPGTAANRKASLKGIPKVPGKDLDEFPPAMFKEGGAGAHVRAIDLSDNRGAGSTTMHQLKKYPDGTRMQFIIV